MAAATPDLATVPLRDTGAAESVEGAESVAPPSPHELPDVKLSDGMRKRIAKWLTEEINAAKKERATLEEEWREIEDLYEKTTLDEKKNFPFEGAAHLMVSVIATYSEEIWARLHNTIFAPSDPFTAQPVGGEMLPYVDALKKFMTIVTKEELKLKQVSTSLFLELVQLGSMVAKAIYTVEEREIYTFDTASQEWLPLIETTKHQPEVIPVPLEDFLFRMSARTMEECEWKAHRVRLSWHELLHREKQGIFKDIKPLKGQGTKDSDADAARQEREGVSVSQSQQPYECYEVWFEFPIGSGDDDAEEESDDYPVRLVAWIHPETEHILRIQHNWYPLQLDPFELCPFIPSKQRIFGLGVGKMGKAVQLEVSTMHNQRLDNATLANTVVLKTKVDSSVPMNGAFRPGMNLPVDEQDDIQPMNVGQRFDSTIGEENHTLSMLERRIGIQDFRRSDNATGSVMQQMQSASKSDIIIGEITEFFSRLMTKVLLLYQQYYPGGKPLVLLGADGSYVEQVFQLPPRTILQGLRIKVTATTTAESKEMARSSKLSIFNLLTQYYGQLTQYLIQSQSPQMPLVAQFALLAIVDALSAFVYEILDDFDVEQRERLTIGLDRLSELAAQLGPAQGAPGADAAPGMEAVPGAAPEGAPEGGEGATAG